MLFGAAPSTLQTTLFCFSSVIMKTASELDGNNSKAVSQTALDSGTFIAVLQATTSPLESNHVLFQSSDVAKSKPQW